MKYKLLYPFLLGALGVFFTAPYNMSGMITIPCLATMGYYFLYGIALQLKWNYSPSQVVVFWLAQPILYLFNLFFVSNLSHIQAEVPYLFPIYIPIFIIVAALSLALGYVWTLPQINKSTSVALTLIWLSGGFFLLTEGLPRL